VRARFAQEQMGVAKVCSIQKKDVTAESSANAVRNENIRPRVARCQIAEIQCSQLGSRTVLEGVLIDRRGRLGVM